MKLRDSNASVSGSQDASEEAIGLPGGCRTTADMPLSALLSQALVAFTIEVDNEFERIMLATGSSRFWMSLVMWANFLRFVDEEGVTVGDLSALARIPEGALQPSVAGMERWGYVLVERPTAARRSVAPDWIVRPTPAGRKAREEWPLLPGEIEGQWRKRFGEDEIARLQESLWALQPGLALPQYLPAPGYGMFAVIPPQPSPAPIAGDDADSSLPLFALLSKVLFAFTIEFEQESDISLPMSANVLRVLDERGTPVRDLPRLSGVSKEAIRMMVGYLERQGIVRIGQDLVGGRTKVICLTSAGQKAWDTYCRLTGVIEGRWRARFGMDKMCSLRKGLEALVGTQEGACSPLYAGLEPPPGGWRASVCRPEVIPHYPMVLLHRGGWPDGS